MDATVRLVMDSTKLASFGILTPVIEFFGVALQVASERESCPHLLNSTRAAVAYGSKLLVYSPFWANSKLLQIEAKITNKN